MRDDEMIDVCAPFNPGAHTLNDSAGGAHAAVGSSTGGKMSPQQPLYDFDMDIGFSEDSIVNNVENFLDDFLALAGSDPAGDGLMNVGDADLAWLDDPDAFLPPGMGGEDETPPAQRERDVAAVSVVCPPEEQQVAAVSVVPAPGSIDGTAGTSVDDSAAVMVTPGLTSAGAAHAEVDMVESAVTAAIQDNPGVSAPAATEAVQVRAQEGTGAVSEREVTRRQKVARYLEKKKRRRWSRSSSYESRQQVANTRPRHKGRFLPLKSDFIPIAELQRRQRALMKQMQDKAALQQQQQQQI